MNDQLENIVRQTNAKPATGNFFFTLCPWHDDKEPSLYLNENGCGCMSCGKQATLDELAEKLVAA